MSVYTEAGKSAYQEAIRTIPGLLAAKQRSNQTEALVLLTGMFETTKDLGLSQEDTWHVMFNASMHWISQLAASAEIEPEMIVAKMAALATSWVANVE